MKIMEENYKNYLRLEKRVVQNLEKTYVKAIIKM